MRFTACDLVGYDVWPVSKLQDAIQVEFVRVKYEVEKAAQAVELSLLPDAFADN